MNRLFEVQVILPLPTQVLQQTVFTYDLDFQLCQWDARSPWIWNDHATDILWRDAHYYWTLVCPWLYYDLSEWLYRLFGTRRLVLYIDDLVPRLEAVHPEVTALTSKTIAYWPWSPVVSVYCSQLPRVSPTSSYSNPFFALQRLSNRGDNEGQDFLLVPHIRYAKRGIPTKKPWRNNYSAEVNEERIAYNGKS